MSVTNTNDPINDLLAAADAARAVRDNDRTSETSDGDAAPSEENVTAQFSRLLKERLTGNIVFTRLDQQLDLPQRVVSERASAPVLDRRDELDDRDGVDPFDATDSLEQPAAAPVDAGADRSRVDPVRVDPAPRADSAPTRNDTGASGQGTANQGDDRGQGQGNAAADAARKGAATQANQAVQRTQSGDGLVAEDAAPELAAIVTRQAKSDGKLTATVTQEQARVASQPQAALAARASVDASAATRSSATPDAGLTAGGEDGLATDGEANVTSIFDRVRANAAPGAKGQAAANSNTPDGNDAAKSGQNGQAAQQQAQQVGQALHRVASTGLPGATSGATQAGITVVDGATGGTASIGENNSVQQRSAPAATQAANRPPPLPPGMLADQVAVNIQKGLAQGQDKITVQLRPAELGRVEIKLEMNHDGKMTAVVAAEKPETLDMLRQDARSLIDSLNQAGMKMDESGLNFTLQDGQHGAGGDGDLAQSGGNRGDAEGETDPLLETGFQFEETGGFEADGRLDVRI